MKLNIENFSKERDFLVCIDSDGTAMDVMNIKHIKCFGPCLVKEWKLEKHAGETLKIWNEINLYSETRGKNRFLTLLYTLTRLSENKVINIPDLAVLKKWVENAKELSNSALAEEVKKNESDILQKTLCWSIETNKEIAKLTFEDKVPFSGVIDFLEFAQGKVDIAVVSSAGFDAIYEEWNHYDMLKYLNVMTTQETGSKRECISKLMRKGYKKENILKIGDAPPDLQAADANGVSFYPIIAGSEESCWRLLKEKYFNCFLTGTYAENEKTLRAEFNSSFAKK